MAEVTGKTRSSANINPVRRSRLGQKRAPVRSGGRTMNQATKGGNFPVRVDDRGRAREVSQRIMPVKGK